MNKGQQITDPLPHDIFIDILADLRQRGDLTTHTICMLMGIRALRISDVLNLKIQDVFFSTGKLRPYIKNFTSIKQKKKITIPLNPKDQDSYFVRMFETYWHLISDRDPASNLFEGATTPVLSQSVVKQRLKRYRNDFNIQCSPHSFRKHACREMFNNKVPISVIMKYLGHSSPDITLRYISVNSQDIEQAIDSINF